MTKYMHLTFLVKGSDSNLVLNVRFVSDGSVFSTPAVCTTMDIRQRLPPNTSTNDTP